MYFSKFITNQLKCHAILKFLLTLVMFLVYLGVQLLHADQIDWLEAVAVGGDEVEAGVNARIMEAENKFKFYFEYPLLFRLISLPNLGNSPTPVFCIYYHMQVVFSKIKSFSSSFC